MASLNWNVNGDGAWDFSSINWLQQGDDPDSGGPAAFVQNDSVIFSTRPVGPYTVTIADSTQIFVQGLSSFSSDVTIAGGTGSAIGFLGPLMQIEGTATISATVNSGSINQIGSGNLILSGLVTTNGSITVGAGTVTVNGAATQLSEVSVALGATLAGNGVITTSGTVLINGDMNFTGTLQSDVTINNTVSSVLRTGSDADMIAVNVNGVVAGNILSGKGGDNISLFGIASSDILSGAGKDVIIVNGTVTGKINGGKGNDLIDADFGSVSGPLSGGRGSDMIIGTVQSDLIRGDEGKDILNGGEGGDRIEGGADRDVIIGGGGADLIIGGAGRDEMTGGSDADTFIFRDIDDFAGGGATERITDFTQGEDIIRLRSIDADTTSLGDQNFTFIGGAGFSGTAGELRATVGTGQTVIRGDVNGDGQTDFALVLTGEMTLTGADFVF